jgi:putative transposase
MDCFVMPPDTFRLLYVLIILNHGRRRCIIHFHVMTSPTAVWVRRQRRQAFPFETAPRYLIRDRDGVYGDEVRRCLANLHIEEVMIAPRSPWHDGYWERLIGTLRRELLDHVIVWNEDPLRRLLSASLAYYHQARPHMGLNHNAPKPREVEMPERGRS